MLIDECQVSGFNLKENLKGGTMMLDFEKAMINATKIHFQDCKVQGCRFHLGQSWWRKMKNLGLAKKYKMAHSPEGRWLRGVFGLPLLPGLMINRAFKLYCRSPSGRSPALKQFKEYMFAVYIGASATFPITMWADLEGPRTNNGAESFHRHFGDLFGYLKSIPSIWHFLRNMAQWNVIKSIKMNSEKTRKTEENNLSHAILNYLRNNDTEATLGDLSLRNMPKCVLRRRARK